MFLQPAVKERSAESQCCDQQEPGSTDLRVLKGIFILHSIRQQHGSFGVILDIRFDNDTLSVAGSGYIFSRLNHFNEGPFDVLGPFFQVDVDVSFLLLVKMSALLLDKEI